MTNNASLTYSLTMYDSNINPRNGYFKTDGFALRSIGTRRYPLSYVLSGDYRWDTSILEHQGDYGGWWSTTTENSASAFFFAIVPTSINPTNNWSKISGWALHCITPSAPPFPVGIRFRMCSQATTAGAVVT